MTKDLSKVVWVKIYLSKSGKNKNFPVISVRRRSHVAKSTYRLNCVSNKLRTVSRKTREKRDWLPDDVFYLMRKHEIEYFQDGFALWSQRSEDQAAADELREEIRADEVSLYKKLFRDAQKGLCAYPAAP